MRRSAGIRLNNKTDADLARYLEGWGAEEKKPARSSVRYLLMPELGDLRLAWANKFPAPAWDKLAVWGLPETRAGAEHDDDRVEDDAQAGEPF